MKKPDLNDAQLQEMTDRIAKTWFQDEYPGRATFNARLQTTGGRYFYGNDNIEINPKMENYGYDNLMGIIKHELCHYEVKRTYGTDAKQHGKEFKHILRAVGGQRYAPTPKDFYKYIYQCNRCHHIYYRRRRVDLSMYHCKCGGSLTSIPDQLLPAAKQLALDSSHS